jgi:tetratricopeptide (TPR) repeat protein
MWKRRLSIRLVYLVAAFFVTATSSEAAVPGKDELFKNCRDVKRELVIEKREAYCAILFWRGAADTPSETAESYMRFALIYLRDGQYERGMSWLNHAAEELRSAKDGRGLVFDIVGHMAHAAKVQGDDTDAFSSTLAKGRTVTPTIAYLAGMRALRRDDVEAAVIEFNQALTLDGSHVDSLLERAEALDILNRPAEAERDVDRVMNISPRNSRARSIKAIHLLEADQDANAIEQFKLAAKLDRDNHSAHYALTQLLGIKPVGDPDYDLALFHAREELRLHSSDPQGYYDLAVLLTRTGQTEEAFRQHRVVAYQYYGYAAPYQQKLVEKGFLEPGEREDWDAESDAALRACVEAGCIPFSD